MRRLLLAALVITTITTLAFAVEAIKPGAHPLIRAWFFGFFGASWLPTLLATYYAYRCHDLETHARRIHASEIRKARLGAVPSSFVGKS